ncbi:MAG: hypothetical protein HOH43_01125 [Candidatus Latescibacteria bacterium]|nr:hypothetical protein [Candidatus Latescibacterota bacterium]
MDADFKAAMEALNKDDIQTYEEFLREWAREAISKHGGIYAEDGTPNNAEPLAEGRCCDACNKDVILRRISYRPDENHMGDT